MVIQDPAETAAIRAAKKRRTTGNLRERAEAEAEEAARMVGRGKFAVEGGARGARVRTQSAPVRVGAEGEGSPRYSPYQPTYTSYEAGHYGSPLHQHAQIPGGSQYPSPAGVSVGSHSSPYGPGPSSAASPRRLTPLSAQHHPGPSRYYGAQLSYGGQVTQGQRDSLYPSQHQQPHHQLQHHYSNPSLQTHNHDLDDGSSDSQISPGGRVTLPSISRLLPSQSDPQLSDGYYTAQDTASSVQSAGFGGELQHQQHLAMQHYHGHNPHHQPYTAADPYARGPEGSGSPGPSNGSSFGDAETVPHSSWAGASGYVAVTAPVTGASSAHMGYVHAPAQVEAKPFALPSYAPVAAAQAPGGPDSYSNQYNQLPAGYGPGGGTPQGSPVRGYASVAGGGQRESSERSSIPASASVGGGWSGAQGGGLMEMVVGGGAGGGEGGMWATGTGTRYQLPPQAVGSA